MYRAIAIRSLDKFSWVNDTFEQDKPGVLVLVGMCFVYRPDPVYLVVD